MTFAYLYPIQEYLEYEITSGARARVTKYIFKHGLGEGLESTPVDYEDLYHNQEMEFRRNYFTRLNDCINSRYRNAGAKVLWVIFRDTPIHPHVLVDPNDVVYRTAMSYEDFTEPEQEEYPDLSRVLEVMPSHEPVWVGGFHMWDCVDRFAKLIYESGRATCVDEDLTDMFKYRCEEPWFDINSYGLFEAHNDMTDDPMFRITRSIRPWLYNK